MSITPRKCKAAALATAPVAAALGAYGFLKGATKFYSSQVNGTPEQYKMTLPGDDLVPEGSPRFKRLTHVEDLDAPCDEVWKHVYQLNTTTAGFYSFTFFEKMFGLSVDNTFMVEQAWQDPDYYKPGDMFCWSYAGFGAGSPTWSPASIWCGSLTPVTAPGHRAQASCYRLECRGTAGVGLSPWNPSTVATGRASTPGGTSRPPRSPVRSRSSSWIWS